MAKEKIEPPKAPKKPKVEKLVMIRNGQEYKIKAEYLQDFIDAGWKKKGAK